MKVYLAGPDVFRADAGVYGEHLKRLCAGLGLTGLYPLDTEISTQAGGHEAAAEIYHANIALIREADAVVANLNRFRGDEPDSGTAFEVGFATALGKPVWAYTEDGRSIVEQMTGQAAEADGHYQDARGYTIENFDLNLNLMLACSVTLVIGDAEACLKQLAAGLAS